MSASRARVALAAAVALTGLAGCSGDDDDAATTSGPPTSAAAVTAPPVTAPPVTAATSATAAPATAGPPASAPGVDLTPVLLDAADAGVPDTWVVRDLRPEIMDDALVADADPLQGLATCPDAAFRPAGTWVQRTFTSPDQPLGDGLLRVDLLVAVEDAAGFAARRAGLAACASASGDAFLDVHDVELDGGVAATELVLAAAPSADVPYPSAYGAVAAHADGRTVVAVAGGVDLGVRFEAATRELVGRLLART